MKMLQILIIVFLVIVLSSFAYGACNTTALLNNAIHYYKFEENGATPYVDAVATADLTTGNTPDRTAGILDFGQDFARTNSDYIYYGQSTHLEDSTLGISFWIRPSSNANTRMVMGYSYYDSTDYFGWYIHIRDDNEIRVVMYDGSGAGSTNEQCKSDASNLPTDEWSNVVVNIYSDDCEIFVNTTDWDNSHTGAIVDLGYSTGNHYYGVGSIYLSSWNTNYYDGDLDEIAIFDTPLDADCRAYLYNSGSPNSTQQYPFSSDSTPPNITLVYPTNATHYNDYNGSIIVYDDLASIDNCVINDGNWLQNGTNGTHYWFYRATTPNANYSLNVSCWDALDNNKTINFWFTTDTVNPSITVTEPINNSYHNSNVDLNVSYYDTWLYRTNTTINRETDDFRLVTNMTIGVGTYSSGNLASLATNDADYYKFFEGNGVTPGAILYMNITDIPSINKLDSLIHYDGNPAHNAYLFIWNKTGWENLGALPSGAWTTINSTFTSDIYVTDSQVQLMINHTSAGVQTHFFELDLIKAYTDNVYYNNYSGNLGGATTYYNISQTLSISNWAEGEYTLITEATDTHTTSYFDEELITYVVELPNDNLMTIYELSKGEINFIYPSGLNLQSHKLTDRITQEFINTGALEEIELEIEAVNIDYLANSVYPCHLIINNAYWFDCVGLPNPEVIESTNTKFVVKSFINGEGFTLESLGGLNYLNQTNKFFIDITNPAFTGNTTSATSSTSQLDFNVSENVTVSYRFGLNCTPTASPQNRTLNDTFSLSTLGLTASTQYWYNVTLTDQAGNTANDCFNVTTLAATPATNTTGCNCTQIRTIVQEEIRGETMYIALGIIILGTIAMLVSISEKMDFLYFRRKDGEPIYFMKYLTVLVAGWLLLAAVNVGIKLVEVESAALANTIGGFYKSVMWVMIILTTTAGLYLIMQLFMWLGKETMQE